MTVVALRETPRRDTRKPRTAPEPPFECGHYGEPVWYAPEKWSADWLFDPVPQYQCPRCGRCLGAEPMTYADSPTGT